jgi:hypothetical protein
MVYSSRTERTDKVNKGKMISDRTYKFIKIIETIFSILFILVAIYGFHSISNRPKIEVTQDRFSKVCVSEYDFKVNKICLYATTTNSKIIYDYISTEQGNNKTEV